MKPAHLLQLSGLAALWGGSYLCMRLGADAFGTLALAGSRASLAAACLLPLVLLRGETGALRKRWRRILLIGLTQSALPFVLFNFAALSLPAGVSAILTATTPLFSALIGRWWLGETLAASRVVGLAVGFGGVLWIAWDRVHLSGLTGWAQPTLAIGACLLASLLYGFSGHFAKHHLGDVAPLAVTAGCQIVSAAVLGVPALLAWPAVPPAPRAWAALFALAIGCTVVAYVLFFRLIARIGAARTATVTFLIPAFAQIWGFAFLRETPTPTMLLGCVTVLAGTALGTGLVRLPVPTRQPALS